MLGTSFRSEARIEAWIEPKGLQRTLSNALSDTDRVNDMENTQCRGLVVSRFVSLNRMR